MRNLKKFLSLLLVFVMLCGMLGVPAAAATEGTIAAETVTVYLLDKDGTTTNPLATYTADRENDTYKDGTGNEIPGVVAVSEFTNGSLGKKNYILYTGSDNGNFARGPVVTKYIELSRLAETLTNDAYDADTWLIKMATEGDSWVTYYGKPVEGRTDIVDSGATLYASADWLKATIANGYKGSSTLLVDNYSDKYAVPTVLAICSYNERLSATNPTAEALESWADNLAASNDMGNALRLFSGMELNDSDGKYINTGSKSQKGVSVITLEQPYYGITVTDGTAAGTEGADGYGITANNATVTTGDDWFKAAKDEKVTLTVTAAEGYQVDTVAVSGTDTVAVTDNQNGTYTFTMPGEAVTVAVTTSVASGGGAAQTAPSTITTAEELKLLADEVNAGDDKAGKTYTLGNDIDLSGYTDWTPIGQATVAANGTLTLGNAFAGTFDGNKKTISGLRASNATGGVALFGYSTGTIKDLTVSGAVTGNLYTAGVVAVGQGTISGVTSNVNVTLGASGQYAGGIMGEATGTVTITDCHNAGTITNGGGSAEASTGRVGGIVGRVETGITASITNCSNTGSITAYQYVGGIIGGAFGNVEIKGCYNSGTLNTMSWGKTYLGGIAGKLQGGTIDSCYNWGTLNSTPWGSGHIRAVGGIAGCEEDHADGTAITNCYNTGTINLDTSKMVSGKNIYLVGAISGGNNPDGNTMGYEDCFYLADCIPSQDSNHESYQWWNDSWKSNNALYDTANVVAKTADELKGSDVLTALGSSFKAVTNGYPILSWQDGSTQTPTLQNYAIETSVTGGTATVNVAATAQEQSAVNFTVSGIETGKKIKSVTVTDAAGGAVTCTESAGTYTFTMPSRAVTIAVTLENDVAAGAVSYAITLPTGLDAIWEISVDSTQYETATGKATEGATVTIVVEKDEKALGTSFAGVTVTGASSNVEVTAANVADRNGSNYYGEYTFTMPDEDVTVTLNATYADLTVYVKEGEKNAELEKTLTRADMVTLSSANTDTAYYSGWRTETEAFIGVAEQYVTLTQLLTDAGITLEEGDSVTVSTPDNFTLTYTYEQLTAERKYYSDILTNGNAAAQGTAFPYTLVIKGNMVTDADELNSVECDTLYAYRFVYGQTAEELTGNVKCVDSMPQCVTSVTVNKAEKASTGWDGTADTTWYDAANAQTEYIITTAAQLAGLAQLVDDGNIFAGVTFKLGNDIALNEEGKTDNNWNPIGSASYTEIDTGSSSSYGNAYVGVAAAGSKAFAGTFDGQNYKITGLYINSGDSGQGLFAYNAGTVKNLTISGSIVKAGSDYVGSVAGFNSGTISDVISKVTISVGSYNVGGITGYNDGYQNGSEGLIIRCGNDAAVTGSTKVGGICGESTGTIQYCYNKGAVVGTNSGSKNGVGGIVGRHGPNGGGVPGIAVEDCYNAGAVGVNCKWTGGITGFLNPSAIIRNCMVVNFATSGAWNRNNPIAGNVDSADTGDVTNVYSLQGLTASGSWYQEVGTRKTADEMKAASFAASLGGAFVADDSTTPLNNGYPVLYWEKGLTMGTITVDDGIDFGTVTCEATSAAETTTVTVTVTAEKNYKLDTLQYTTDGVTYTDLTATVTEGEYTFVMPKGDVTVTAKFKYTGTYWDGTTINTDWYNTTDTVFVVNTPAELAGFAAIVNGTATGIAQDNFSGKTVQLGTNIALGQDGLYESVANVTYGNASFPMTTTQYYLKEAAPVWTPIGSGSATGNTNATGNTFAGTFDGKGYAITGVYTGGKSATTGNTATVQGLFGIVSGTVQNVTVSGCITGKIVVGGIVAHLNGGTVKNCTNKAIIFADGGTTPAGGVENGVNKGGAVGGIVGNAMTGSTITKCMNEATVINANTCYGGRTGGILGLVDGSNDVVAVSKCGNTGNVETYQYGGGIVGMDMGKNSTIDQCFNTGSVTGHGTQKIHFGGIIGQYGCKITNCYNTGTIIQTLGGSSKANYFGGIGGDINYPNNTGSITNCYNLGAIQIASTYGSHDAGMITGDGSATNSYYLNTLSTSKMYGSHGTAKTSAEMKAAAFLTAINVDNQGAFVSDSADPINNGFPVLGWQLGAEDPIVVSSKSEGEFKSEYIESQKFSIGTFKLYYIYNNDSTTEFSEYEVYVGDTKIDPVSYTFTQDDNGKALKVTWAKQGVETNYVEKTLAITADALTGSFAGNSGSPKLGIYFVDDTIDVSALTKAMYYLTSGGRLTVEGEELANLKWSLKVGDEIVLTFDAGFTNKLTAAHNGAKLIMSYTWRGKTVDKDWGALTVLENKTPNANGFYELSTADDVKWFTAKVNSGATDVKAILMNDIDLTGVSLSSMSNYAGTFDGNGKTLTIKSTLFSSVSTGTVKNLTVTGSVSGSALIGTINGAANVENCVNKATISVNGNNQGGLIGTVSSTATGAVITRCVNEGAVANNGSFTRYSNVGGIVGNIDCADATVSQCVNHGAVTNGHRYGYYSGSFGGIVGTNKGTITDCYNTGTVKSNAGTFNPNYGGIAGVSSGSVVNCYNIGTVHSSGHGCSAAALVCSNSGTVTNSYALTDTNGTLVGGSGTVDTASAFLSSSELKVTDLGEAWALHGDATLNSGYPVLTWQNLLSDWTVSIADGVEGTAIVTPGTNVTLQVKVSGKNFYNVEAVVTYNADVFDYVGCTGWVTGMTVTQESGKIKLVLLSNDAFADGTGIATLVFQAKADLVTGSGTFTFEQPVVYDPATAAAGRAPAALTADTVKVAKKYSVALPADDSLTGETYAYAGEDYTGQIADYDGNNYAYTISVNGTAVTADIAADGKFTVAAADLTADSALTVAKVLKGMTTAVVADYVNGYTMILVEKAADNASTTGYTYNGNAMFYVEAYNAYAWIVSGAVAAEDAAVLVAVNTGETVTIAKDNYNVNTVGGVDFADASVAFFCANVNPDYPMDTMMAYYLRSDVNGDKVVDSDDVADIMASANYNQ